MRKFREHKTFAKKINRALGRNELEDAVRLDKTLRPRMSLDHIIKERYPTFADALRDLDDALTMLFLFANLPSTTAVPPKTVALCQRLTLEFQHYVITARCLRKSFLSIKGIYYQAVIQGQDILWLVPYKFVQKITGDVDFRIMATFLEFYTTLLSFVNYRLYTSIGLIYPPKFNSGSDDRGGDLDAFKLEGKALGDNPENNISGNGDIIKEASEAAQSKADELKHIKDPEDAEEKNANDADKVPAQDNNMSLDKFDAVADDADILPQPENSDEKRNVIFGPYTFYLSRETPRAPLEFLLKAFGCKRIGWDSVLGDGAFTTDEADPRITHQVVDRPVVINNDAENGENRENPQSGSRMPGRVYVQPQWIWDSVNAGELQRADLYAPGATLPPHLSPWVKPKKGQYDPTVPLEEQEPEGEAERTLSEKNIENNVDSHTDHTTHSNGPSTKEALDDTWEGFDDDDTNDVGENNDEDDKDLEHQKELQAEAAGLPYSNGVKDKEGEKAKELRRKTKQKQKEEAEELDRKRMMMSNKKRKTLDRMMFGNSKRNAEAEKLRAKKRRLEAGNS